MAVCETASRKSTGTMFDAPSPTSPNPESASSAEGAISTITNPSVAANPPKRIVAEAGRDGVTDKAACSLSNCEQHVVESALCGLDGVGLRDEDRAPVEDRNLDEESNRGEACEEENDAAWQREKWPPEAACENDRSAAKRTLKGPGASIAATEPTPMIEAAVRGCRRPNSAGSWRKARAAPSRQCRSLPPETTVGWQGGCRSDQRKSSGGSNLRSRPGLLRSTQDLGICTHKIFDLSSRRFGLDNDRGDLRKVGHSVPGGCA